MKGIKNISTTRSGPLAGIVRILSGWSNPGGSTVAFINLTNLLNESGINTIFYGPHDWHLDKCKSQSTQSLDISDPEDILIAHYVPLKDERTPLKKVIFSCHETVLFPLKDFSLGGVDTVHFVSEKQRDWHGIDHPSVVIPNIVKVGKRRGNHKRGYVGVIGSIDSHKQTALAVETALESEPKSTKVLIFGSVTNEEYYQEHLKPLLKNKRVRIVGKYDDKDVMYNMIDAAYHASKYETYGLIRHECALQGIPFNDLFNSSAHSEYWPEERILEAWKKILVE
jgi:glycosyltransferase involved in cell wall biosynthesis